jgi:hypothetical protein
MRVDKRRATSVDDSNRYREWLQKSLLTEGWEAAFDHRRLTEWVRNNRELLMAMAQSCAGDEETVREYESFVQAFSPKSGYDLPTTEAIFRPLFDEIVECAKESGLKPVRDVELITSTSISPTPFAMPTAGTHQLFVGPGTSAFCSYWAKAYTAIVKAISAGGDLQPIMSSENLRSRLSRDPSGINLAVRLALYFSVTGSLLGFGVVDQPPDYYSYRLQLLQSMEIFVLSHEYCHFVAHERELEFRDQDGHPFSQGLELFCDAMGLQLSRLWGSKNNNWLAFTGVGGLAFFRAIDICESGAAELLNCNLRLALPRAKERRQLESDSHPPVTERTMNLITWAIDRTANDEKAAASSFLAEYDLICTTIRNDVSEILRESKQSLNDE